nr:class I SAM-dependent methyltransferase [uncultured Agathobaculum sp.]
MKKKIVTSRNCPVCGCSVAEELFPVNLDLSNTTLPDQYHAVACDYCGMCYADTAASIQDYEQYYSECNYYGGHPGTIKQEEQNRFAVIAEQLQKHTSKDAMILDIGFGKGELLCYLKQHGYTNLQGMDPSVQSVSALQEKGIQGIILSLQATEIPSAYQKKFDVIILTEVWEHLYALKRCIENVKTLLKDSGHLILTLPTFDDLSCYRLPLVNMINHEHINYFSQNSLNFFMNINGMESIELCRTVIEEEGDSITYGVLGIFQIRKFSSIPIKKDETTKITLSNYYVKEQHDIDRKNQILSQYLDRNTPIAIWGAGTYLRQLWHETVLPQCNIVAVIDGSTQKQGQTFERFTIESPEKLCSYDGIVFIAVMRYEKEVRARLRELGFHGDILVI